MMLINKDRIIFKGPPHARVSEVGDEYTLANPLLNLMRDDTTTQDHHVTWLKSYG
jgi:hypothetical protein